MKSFIITIAAFFMCGGSFICAQSAPMHNARMDNEQMQMATADIGTLNYALTLEHLEYAFYRDGLAKFNATDFDEQVFERLQEIRDHERDHVDTLTSVIESLGGEPVPECVYDFGYSDPQSFLMVARALENTGVSAYTGVIADINNPDLVTAGATIATVEARHASYLNEITGFSPFPAAFDTPLNPKTVVSIAGGFITMCPYDIGITGFPKLTATVENGRYNVKFDSSLEQSRTKFYCASLFSNMQKFTALRQDYTCAVPRGASGDVYLFVTNSKTPLTLNDDKSVVAGPAVVNV